MENSSVNNDFYAGFWLRVSAFLIDGFILTVLDYIIIDNIFSNELQRIGASMVVMWLYFTLLNASSWKGTIGKKFVGIELVDYQYQIISLKQANIRYFSSIVSALLFPLYLTVIFSKKKQTIHDMIAKTIVIKTEGVYDYSQGIGEKYKPTSLDLQLQVGRKFGYGLSILFFIGFLVILYFAIPFITVGVSLGNYYSEEKKRYINEHYVQQHSINDYNDSRIIFYAKQLREDTKKFLETETFVSKFEYYNKIIIEEKCIQYYFREHNETDYYDNSMKYYETVRNKLLTNKELVSIYLDKVHDLDSKHWLHYPNQHYQIIDNMTDTDLHKLGSSMCDQQLTSNDFYKVFLAKYLRGNIVSHYNDRSEKFISIHHEIDEWLHTIAKQSDELIFQKYSEGLFSLEEVVDKIKSE